MKKILLTLLLLLSVNKTCFAQDSFNKVINIVEPSTVHLKVIKSINKLNDKEIITSSVGSGVFIDNKGTIVTNAHVVNNVELITVITSNQKQYNATIVGIDNYSDIAVIKINTSSIPIKLSDYSKLNKGDWVFAIGSPLGLQFSVTKGIVSFKDRDTGKNIKFIQNDVPINVGNSGGPLLNTKGELVGINSSLISETGGYQGISLAIPINVVKKVSSELITNGYMDRGTIEVELIELITIVNNIESTNVLVKSNSSDKKGFIKDDIIISIDNQKINNILDVERYLSNIKPKSKVIVSVFRDHKKIDLIIDVIKRKI